MTKDSIIELDRYLEKNGYYSIDPGKNVDSINQTILDQWNSHLQDSITNDLKWKLKEIEIIKTRSLFDLFSDEQGVTLYKLFLDLKDGEEEIEVIVRLIINYKLAVIYLGSRHANEDKYKGESRTLRMIFKELKKSDKDFGYFHPIDFYKFTVK
ncbi:hypothetical protein [Catalinimonas niigatensis]|uniref:hypothetical protein n=1 Tax=Catalinimonas niigatensis TaxID=1397264 RepID=UPI00266589DC|nr:hypothetical protein [Catalinimonas niigatensis]WPP51720.1 hypothetical protein PZB72_04870 [Catalinimonas niigatensis]